MKYNDFSLVLFSGRSKISWLIRFSRWLFKGKFGKFSHVEMIYNIETEQGSMVFGSTSQCDLPDYYTGKQKNGVQCHKLQDRVNDYDGDVYIREFIAPPDFLHAKKLPFSLFRDKFKNVKYEKSPLELLKAEYDGVFGKNKEDTASQFCSEIVVGCLKVCRIIKTSIPANEFTPEDTNKVIDKYVTSGKFGKTILIKKTN